MLLLERLELVEERVVRRVVDLGVVEDVVAVVVVPDQPPELRGALRRRGGRPRGHRAAPRACARMRRAPRRADVRPGGSLPTRPRRRRRPPPWPRRCRTASRRRRPPRPACRRVCSTREQDRLGIGLVPARVLEPDDDVEGARERREAVEREPDGAVALRGHDPELPPLRLEPREDGEQLVERLERLVQPVVVLLVRLEELVDVIRRRSRSSGRRSPGRRSTSAAPPAGSRARGRCRPRAASTRG